MALTINNFWGAETGGLEEAFSTSGSPAASSSNVRTGGYSYSCPSSATIDFDAFEAVADAGSGIVVGFGFRTPATFTIGTRVTFRDSSNNVCFSFVVESSPAGRTVVNDSASSNPILGANLSANTYYYIEIWTDRAASGNAEFFIDGVSQGTATGNYAAASARYVRVQTHTGSGTQYYDDIYVMSGSTAASDRLGGCEVRAYRSTLNSATPDAGQTSEGAAVLTTGVWVNAQEVPFSATNEIALEDLTGLASGYVRCNDVPAGGIPSDSNITGSIVAAKGVWRLYRNNGGGIAMYYAFGANASGNLATGTESTFVDVSGTITTTPAIYTYVSETGDVVPTTSEDTLIGIRRADGGGRDLFCTDMLAQILHVPSATNDYTLDASSGSFTLSGQAADLNRSLQFDASAGSFTLTGQTADLLFGYTIQADAGAFTLSGQAADLDVTWRLQADAGSFALAGSDADLKRALQFDAEAGTFALAGIDAAFSLGFVMAAESGAFALTGTIADLLRSLQLDGDAGTFTLTGDDAAFLRGHHLDADAGTFTLAGVDVAFVTSVTLQAETGTFSLSGQAADLDVTRRLPAETGAFALAGADAAFLNQLRFTADAGTFTLTGITADLNTGVVLSAETGSFTWTGASADLLRALVMEADAGTFALTGSNANLNATGSFPAETGAFTWTGINANLLRGYTLPAVAGSFALSGVAAVLARGYALDAETGAIVLSGTVADLLADRYIGAESGTFALVGQDAAFARDYVVPSVAGVFIVSGVAAEFQRALIMQADAGSFSLAGANANLNVTGDFPAIPGAFIVTGASANLAAHKRLDCAAGSFTFAGEDAAFEKVYAVDAETGNFVLTGTDATLAAQRKLDCFAGTFTFTGNDTNLQRSLRLDADSGAFTLSGEDADFVVGALVLPAETGVFVLVGHNATLTALQDTCDYDGLITILRAAFDHLDTLVYSPQPAILWPGQNTSPPAEGMWLEPHLVPLPPSDRFWDNCASNVVRGNLQVSVYFRPGQGLIAPSELADAVIAHFPKGTVLGPVRVLKRPWQSTAVVEDASKLYVPVTVPYLGHT